MRLSAVVIAAALVASFAYGQNPAQEAKSPEPVAEGPYVSEIIQVKTLSGDSFNRLINLLSVFNVRVRGDEQLRTVIVYAPKDVAAQVRRVVTELDVPGSGAAIGRNVEMTMTLLRCSTKTPASMAALPDGMEAVAKQLRATTQYKDIQLWDVIPLRLQEGKDTTEDMVLPTRADSTLLAKLNMRIRPDAVSRKGQVWSVRFLTMQLDFRVPFVTGTSAGPDGKQVTQFNFQDMGLHTAGDFVEGQKTVLGKISDQGDGSTVFVVVELKVLD